MNIHYSSIKFVTKPKTKNFFDIEGQRFNRLTVIGFAGISKTNKKLWYAVCECERITIAEGHNLKSGHTKSCGCLAEKTKKRGSIKHGATVGGNSVEFNTYHRAKGRCTNPTNPRYKNYGGRGIRFKFRNFQDFLGEIGKRPSSNHSLNRIDNDGDYESGNVEWALPAQQARNKQKTKVLKIDNSSKSLQEWCEQYGANYRNVRRRIYNLGWCLNCAFHMSLYQRCSHKS